jgi:hypothetical protein
MRTPHAGVIAATVLFAITVVAATDDWHLPLNHEQMLPDSIDCWEPALAVAPSGSIFIVAGKRNAPRDRTTSISDKSSGSPTIVAKPLRVRCR